MKINEIDCEALVKDALAARKRSHSPYSLFAVGAALVSESGKTYLGCNIENASYPNGICAEKTAFAKAVSDGETKFTAIAIIGGKKGSDECSLCPPCGSCRQFMSEFCGKDFLIINALTDEKGNILKIKKYTLSELLPERFSL